MMTTVALLAWPFSRLGEAVEALARHSGLAPPAVEIPVAPAQLLRDGATELGPWIEEAARFLGIEAEPALVLYPNVRAWIEASGPSLWRLPGDGEPRFLLLLRGGRRAAFVLGPDRATHRIALRDLRDGLCAEIESPHAPAIERLIQETGIPASRRARARQGLLEGRLVSAPVPGCWLLRLPARASFRRQASGAGLPALSLLLAGAHTSHNLLWVLSWWMVGQGVLGGRLDQGWLVAWALVLLTIVPFQLLATWSQGRLATLGGALLKRRLLEGALRLEPDEVRAQGAGQLLGRVMESQAVEALALGGGFLGLVALIELAIAVAVLSMGAAGHLHATALLAWLGLGLLIAVKDFRQRRVWTERRLEITHDVVERMVGHRTRIAQEEPKNWHDGEDQALERYLSLSRAADRTDSLLLALLPRGWLVLGLASLTPGFVSGDVSAASLAVSLGGLLLAYRAIESLVGSFTHLSGAVLAWLQIVGLFSAATRPEVIGSPAFATSPRRGQERAANDRPVLEAEGLGFRHPRRGEPVLRGCNLRIEHGDRLLLQGPSGSGKSTLAALLAGLRLTDTGLLLLNGLDRRTLGSYAWRQRVVAAPQFHENHVLTETFAFNLLMGRRWPPRRKDLDEAEAICRELGLGELLDRMPAGMFQIVGETGWQLSQGERSRLYVARALLQGADLVLLDESFGALDPENLHRALDCVLSRAPTLLVVAHP